MGNFKNDILRYDKKVILSSTLQNRIILLTTNFCYSNTHKKSISNLSFFLNDITLTLEIEQSNNNRNFSLIYGNSSFLFESLISFHRHCIMYEKHERERSQRARQRPPFTTKLSLFSECKRLGRHEIVTVR